MAHRLNKVAAGLVAGMCPPQTVMSGPTCDRTTPVASNCDNAVS